MQTITAQDGDTWESLATANSVALSSLLVVNGLNPDSCPNAPDVGTTVAIPDPPPAIAAAPGEAHNLDVSSEACLWVRLDMSPDAASDTSDSLRLYSDDGTHDVTLPIANHFTPNGAYVDVLFDSVDSALSYSIDYLTEGGEPITIVSSTPFASLNDDALPGPEGTADSAPDSGSEVADEGDRSLPALHPEAALASLGLPDSDVKSG